MLLDNCLLTLIFAVIPSAPAKNTLIYNIIHSKDKICNRAHCLKFYAYFLNLYFPAGKLAVVQFRVEALPFKKFTVFSLFNNLAVF